MPPSRKVCAVASYVDQHSPPVITVFNISTHKILHSFSCPAETTVVIDMCFSRDGKDLACVTSRTQQTSMSIVYWNMDRLERPPNTGQTTDHVSSIAVCPFDRSVVSTVGRNCLRLWSERPSAALSGQPILGSKDVRDFVAQCWPSQDSLVVSSAEGELLHFFEGSYHKSIRAPAVQKTQSTIGASGRSLVHVKTLVATTTGFLGVTTSGVVGIYIRQLKQVEKDPSATGDRVLSPRQLAAIAPDFILSSTITLSTPHDDAGLSFATVSSRPHGENNELRHIIVGYSDGDMREFEMPSELDPAGNLPTDPSWTPPSNEALQTWTHSCHTGAIRGLSVARIRPIAVSVGKDRRCIIWDLDTMNSLSVQNFMEEPQAVAMSPDGNLVAVAFGARVRMFEVAVGELIELGSVAARTSALKSIQFSDSGNFFAISSGPQLRVHDTSNLQLLSVLTQDAMSPIVDFSWGVSPDNELVAAMEDGTVVWWRRSYDFLSGETTFVIFAECSERPSQTVAVGLLNGGKTTLVAGHDGSLREFHTSRESLLAAAAPEVENPEDQKQLEQQATTAGVTLSPVIQLAAAEGTFPTDYPSQLITDKTGQYEFVGVPYGSANGSLSVIPVPPKKPSDLETDDLGERDAALRRTVGGLPASAAFDNRSPPCMLHRGGVSATANFCGKYILSGALDGSIFVSVLTDRAHASRGVVSASTDNESEVDNEGEEGKEHAAGHSALFLPSHAFTEAILPRDEFIGENNTPFSAPVTAAPEDTRMKALRLQAIPVEVLESHALASIQAERELANLGREKDVEMHVAQINAEERLAEQMSQAAAAQAELQRQLDELGREKTAAIVAAQENLEAVQSEHRHHVEKLEANHHRDLRDAQDRADQLREEKEELAASFDAQIASQKQEFDDTLTLERRRGAEVAATEASKVSAVKRQHQEKKGKLREELSQQEEEYEHALAELEEGKQHRIQIERDAAMALRGENALLKRDRENMVQETKAMREQMEQHELERIRAVTRAEEQAEQLAALNKEIGERNFTIGQKENRVLDLKLKNQELEKYRFVLDYKIADLDRELAPKEALVFDLQNQIKEMDAELQRITKSHEQLELGAAERSMFIKSLHREIAALKSELGQKDKVNRVFVEDIHRLYTQTDQKLWAKGVKTLFETYVSDDSGARRVTQEDKDRMQELARQRQHMEHSLNVLQDKAARADERLKTDITRKVAENSMLIAELNTLRKENRGLKQQILVLENQIKSGAVTAAERVRETRRQQQHRGGPGRTGGRSQSSQRAYSAGAASADFLQTTTLPRVATSEPRE
jgi:WD40 repeat protein